jgi:phosphopantetheinyl transferase (holo-ACP synthase)
MSGKRKTKPLPVLVGIGIDLLALDRARDLLKRHGNSFLNRILSPVEIKRKPAYSALQLAKYFTAKEAFFKSSDLNWTDLRGFSGMWISRMRGNQFEMECSDPSLHGSGTFFKRGNLWGAKVIAWK